MIPVETKSEGTGALVHYLYKICYCGKNMNASHLNGHVGTWKCTRRCAVK